MRDDHLYDYYKVSLRFRERVYGGIPKTKELIDNYVSSKFGVENLDLAEKLKGEMDIQEETEKITTGFKRDKRGRPYLCDYQVKAMLRQAATRLKLTTATGKKGLKQDLTDGLFVDRQIVLTLLTDLQTEDFVGHVTTRQGKRSILKASEYVEKAEIKFMVKILRAAVISKENLKDLFLLGQEIGLGSNRSFENGKFDLLSLKKHED